MPMTKGLRVFSFIKRALITCLSRTEAYAKVQLMPNGAAGIMKINK